MTPAWTLASSEFAKQATGVSKVLLNATRANNKDAYADGSFFRTVEMPELQVDKLVVYLASSIGKEVRETCNDSISMENIRKDAESRNIAIECLDQPSLVLNVFCLKYPAAKECVRRNTLLSKDIHHAKQISTPEDEVKLWKTVCIVLIGVCGVLLMYIVMTLVHRSVCVGKTSNFKYPHTWSMSKKPMLSNDEIDNNNDLERVV
ncbi:ADP-ribosyl cyclase/cyclic ADP-ribose hydrolase-like [Clytia hemisphaerica]|uniref:ADP-ribosyl cyclase/cyclic ADP-ribose hydrolase-like n=1 Tax=Clytia hemisphaerica TaxID=252671 RepID=UPI0034D44463